MAITPEQLAQSGTEDGYQAAVFCYFALNRKQYPETEWMHAIPNGGSRDKREANKLIGTGTRSGVFDIFLPVPMQTQWAVMVAGLYIEMKKPGRQKEKNGGLTKEQLEFKEFADSMGYRTAVCYSWQEAVDVVIKYLKGE
jgi:hypothetical protein